MIDVRVRSLERSCGKLGVEIRIAYCVPHVNMSGEKPWCHAGWSCTDLAPLRCDPSQHRVNQSMSAKMTSSGGPLVICEAFMNSLEASAVGLGALSDCIRVGVPWRANHCCKSKREVVIASYSSWLQGTYCFRKLGKNVNDDQDASRAIVGGADFMWSYWTSSLKYPLWIFFR